MATSSSSINYMWVAFDDIKLLEEVVCGAISRWDALDFLSMLNLIITTTAKISRDAGSIETARGIGADLAALGTDDIQNVQFSQFLNRISKAMASMDLSHLEVYKAVDVSPSPIWSFLDKNAAWGKIKVSGDGSELVTEALSALPHPIIIAFLCMNVDVFRRSQPDTALPNTIAPLVTAILLSQRFIKFNKKAPSSSSSSASSSSEEEEPIQHDHPVEILPVPVTKKAISYIGTLEMMMMIGRQVLGGDELNGKPVSAKMLERYLSRCGVEGDACPLAVFDYIESEVVPAPEMVLFRKHISSIESRPCVSVGVATPFTIKSVRKSLEKTKDLDSERVNSKKRKQRGVKFGSVMEYQYSKGKRHEDSNSEDDSGSDSDSVAESRSARKRAKITAEPDTEDEEDRSQPSSVMDGAELAALVDSYPHTKDELLSTFVASFERLESRLIDVEKAYIRCLKRKIKSGKLDQKTRESILANLQLQMWKFDDTSKPLFAFMDTVRTNSDIKQVTEEFSPLIYKYCVAESERLQMGLYGLTKRVYYPDISQRWTKRMETLNRSVLVLGARIASRLLYRACPKHDEANDDACLSSHKARVVAKANGFVGRLRIVSERVAQLYKDMTSALSSSST